MASYNKIMDYYRIQGHELEKIPYRVNRLLLRCQMLSNKLENCRLIFRGLRKFRTTYDKLIELSAKKNEPNFNKSLA